jgi:hypothetical protein
VNPAKPDARMRQCRFPCAVSLDVWYFWILVGIVAGTAFGFAAPSAAVALKPVADGFINLVKISSVQSSS